MQEQNDDLWVQRKHIQGHKDVYAVTFYNLQDYVRPEWLVPKVYRLEEIAYHRGTQNTEVLHWEEIQHGVAKDGKKYAYTMYPDGQIINSTYKLFTQDVAGWFTPVNEYRKLNNAQMEITNRLTSFLNSRPTTLFWHLGGEDVDGDISGLHMHCFIQSPVPMWRNYDFETLTKDLREKYGLMYKSHKVGRHFDLMKEAMKPPRVYAGSNHRILKNTCLEMVKGDKSLLKWHIPETLFSFDAEMPFVDFMFFQLTRKH